jgi:hypothetical protein
MKNQEDKINQLKGEGSEVDNAFTDSLAFQIEEKGLECKALENNPIFQKLRLRLRKFFSIAENHRKNGPTK